MDKRREIMLNLDDFGRLKDINISNSEKEEKKITPEEVEKFYQEKIIELEQNFKKSLEETKEEYYKKGFLEASKQKDEEYSKKIEELKKELLKQKKEEIEKLNEKYVSIEKEIRQKLDNYLTNLNNILLDNLEDILEYLYIQKSNDKVIEKAVLQIISEFKESFALEIRVSPSIYENIKKSVSSIKVEKDESLKDGDFIIEFYDFKLENRFKEKIEVLKDEIKREIKKLT